MKQLFSICGLSLIFMKGICNISFADLIIETASTNFSQGGAGIGIRGTRFHLSVPTHITQVETVFLAGDELTPTGWEPRRYDILSLFMSLNSETGFPDTLFQDENDLSLALAQSASTYWTPGTGIVTENVQVQFTYDLVLPAGNYALILSGYSFGFNAGGMPSSSPLLFGHNIYLYEGSGGPYWSPLSDDYRFVVEGTAIPETGTGVLLLVGAFILLFIARRRDPHSDPVSSQ